jgi:hypothetical protein
MKKVLDKAFLTDKDLKEFPPKNSWHRKMDKISTKAFLTDKDLKEFPKNIPDTEGWKKSP